MDLDPVFGQRFCCDFDSSVTGTFMQNYR